MSRAPLFTYLLVYISKKSTFRWVLQFCCLELADRSMANGGGQQLRRGRGPGARGVPPRPRRPVPGRFPHRPRRRGAAVPALQSRARPRGAAVFAARHGALAVGSLSLLSRLASAVRKAASAPGRGGGGSGWGEDAARGAGHGEQGALPHRP
uniref:Uncharacterized protein n=1 Tax=Arundo donax TaxID=35708 RepID=A0A0A9H8W6_ARUDO